jgi:hypothetical protein
VTSEDDSDGATDKNTKHESLRAGLENAHVVILACTQTKENVGMVDDAFLNATRDGCVLVNVARGGLFQPDAILRALDGETTEKKKVGVRGVGRGVGRAGESDAPARATRARVLHAARGGCDGRLV